MGFQPIAIFLNYILEGQRYNFYYQPLTVAF